MFYYKIVITLVAVFNLILNNVARIIFVHEIMSKRYGEAVSKSENAQLGTQQLSPPPPHTHTNRQKHIYIHFYERRSRSISNECQSFIQDADPPYQNCL